MLSVNKLKRKNNSLPLYVKLSAIEELENNSLSVNQIADNLHVHHTTVRSWQKNKDKLCEWSSQFSFKIPKKQKRLRQSENEEIDKAMWMWFNTKRATGIPLTGPLIKAQALRFKNEFGKDKFNASNGWLRTWKNRYGIRAVNICGEKLSANHQAVDQAVTFKEKFLTYIKAENS